MTKPTVVRVRDDYYGLNATRPLADLVEEWQEVLRLHPDAKLEVECGWQSTSYFISYTRPETVKERAARLARSERARKARAKQLAAKEAHERAIYARLHQKFSAKDTPNG